MTTKEQERQAIAKIRRIVEGLGENSYVGTAMDGVLEVAEQNIEYDAAFSLKGSAEVAERREKEMKERAEKLEEELKAAKAELAQGKEWWKDQQAELKKQLQDAQRRADRYEMPEEMLEGLNRILEAYKEQEENRMNEAAILLANCVGETNVSPGIYDVANRFRKTREKAARCRLLLKELNERYRDGNEGGGGNE